MPPVIIAEAVAGKVAQGAATRGAAAAGRAVATQGTNDVASKIGRLFPKGSLNKESINDLQKLNGVNTKQGANKIFGAIESRERAQNAKKDAAKRQKSKKQPKPRKRAPTWFAVLIISLTVIIDIVEFVLDILVIGLVAIRIIDVIVACVLLIIMFIKRLRIGENVKLYLSVVMAFVTEEIPIIDAAPFWTLDAIYIISTLRADDKAYNEAIALELAEKTRKETIRDYYTAQRKEQDRVEELTGEQVESPVTVAEEQQAIANTTKEQQPQETETAPSVDGIQAPIAEKPTPGPGRVEASIPEESSYVSKIGKIPQLSAPIAASRVQKQSIEAPKDVIGRIQPQEKSEFEKSRAA